MGVCYEEMFLMFNFRTYAVVNHSADADTKPHNRPNGGNEN